MSYRFRVTPAMLAALQIIERSRAEIGLLRLPPAVAERLRQQARLRSTHFSTRIEGNRLTLEEAARVIWEGARLPGRQRDAGEVARYYMALAQVEAWTARGVAITETRIRKLHALLYRGRRARPTLYRDGQNVIRDQSGGIVYLPPEAKDVPGLMRELVQWLHQAADVWPVPIIAGVGHYQLVTIHPFYDGNGRTARLLATWILHRGGYDLNGFYALEEHYARDLQGYYAALVTHPHHNYYEGRHQADITPWLEYFLDGMAQVFHQVADEVRRLAARPQPSEPAWLQALDARARRVVALLERQGTIRSAEVAALLGIGQRHARNLLRDWVAQGWLEVADTSRKGRRYRLRHPWPPTC
ncbi:MAG: Fic family protein [Chloroflexi bacterium]|nr:Fic family protein [Chloroflexota bacterium]